MRYKVPKFLEHQTKFFNLLTFRQLIILGIVGGVLFGLYYIVPPTAFYVIFFATVTVVLLFLFVRVEGYTIPQLIAQYFSFFTSAKRYFWEKKDVPPHSLRIKYQKPKEEEKEREPLKISPGSRIKELSSQLEWKQNKQ